MSSFNFLIGFNLVVFVFNADCVENYIITKVFFSCKYLFVFAF